MNKKKMILTSLASVAILGAGFVASSPTVVRAEEAPVASQSKAEKDYDTAKRDAENAKKALEEAKRAQEKYADYQRRIEEKAAKETQASLEQQEANKDYQLKLKKYLDGRNLSNSSVLKKEMEEAEKKDKEKQAEFNKIRRRLCS